MGNKEGLRWLYHAGTQLGFSRLSSSPGRDHCRQETTLPRFLYLLWKLKKNYWLGSKDVSWPIWPAVCYTWGVGGETDLIRVLRRLANLTDDLKLFDCNIYDCNIYNSSQILSLWSIKFLLMYVSIHVYPDWRISPVTNTAISTLLFCHQL